MKFDYDALKKSAQADQEQKLAEAERAHEPSDAFQKRVWRSIQQARSPKTQSQGSFQIVLEFFRRHRLSSLAALTTVLLFLFFIRPWFDGALVLASASEAVRGTTGPASTFAGHLRMRLLLGENPQVTLQTDKGKYSAELREVSSSPTNRTFALGFNALMPDGEPIQLAEGQLVLRYKEAVVGIPTETDVKDVRLTGILNVGGSTSNRISRLFVLPP